MSKSGEQNHNWRGGKTIASNGYVLVRVGKDHHLADVRGYAYEHRLVAEEKIGRKLEPGEQVHHLNGIKRDNRPENVEVMKSIAHHQNQHRKNQSKRRLADQESPMVQCACGCGEWFNRYDSTGRPRDYITGHNPPDLSIQTAFLAACGEGKTISEISAITGQSQQAVKVMACKLIKSGKLQRKERGIYGRHN